jgi:hypothetical protein
MNGHVQRLLQEITYMCYSGHGNKDALGMNGRVAKLLDVVTWQFYNGHGNKDALGMKRHVQTLRKEITYTCYNGHDNTGALSGALTSRRKYLSPHSNIVFLIIIPHFSKACLIASMFCR